MQWWNAGEFCDIPRYYCKLNFYDCILDFICIFSIAEILEPCDTQSQQQIKLSLNNNQACSFSLFLLFLCNMHEMVSHMYLIDSVPPGQRWRSWTSLALCSSCCLTAISSRWTRTCISIWNEVSRTSLSSCLLWASGFTQAACGFALGADCSPKNENPVINYSPSCRSKPVRPSFILRAQIKIFYINNICTRIRCLFRSKRKQHIHVRCCWHRTAYIVYVCDTLQNGAIGWLEFD